MMKRALLILPVILILFACKNNSKEEIPPPPENVVSQQEMVDILVDVQLIEAAIKSDNDRKRKSDLYTNYYYDYLFEKHSISKDDFLASLKYYQENIQLFDEIYAEVIEQLSTLQSEIEN